MSGCCLEIVANILLHISNQYGKRVLNNLYTFNVFECHRVFFCFVSAICPSFINRNSFPHGGTFPHHLKHGKNLCSFGNDAAGFLNTSSCKVPRSHGNYAQVRICTQCYSNMTCRSQRRNGSSLVGGKPE